MSTSTPYLRLTASQPLTVFKAGAEDIILTVEFKNLNSSRVRFSAELVDDTKRQIGLPVKVEIDENKTYKRFNIRVKAGKTLVVSTTIPGFAVRAYKPALYSESAVLNIGNDQTVPVTIRLDADGVHDVKVVGLPQGVTIDKNTAQIQEGMPVTFNVTRDAVSRVVGALFFKIDSLNIGTVVDVLVEEPQPNDGEEGGSGDCDPDFNADLVASYISGRDSVTHIQP